ncbi:MAG: glycosyltransferase family 4 protein [Anaerolineales bacterium]|nr:glycosyltransferase family 4 protein [Anaerolineales bacterium]
MNHLHRICVVPAYAGVGGPASFSMRFRAGAERLGIEICTDLDDHPYDAVLVIGGSRQLVKLWQVRQAGIPIVQRLDGFNWLHRRVKTSLTYRAGAEIRNWILRIIRRHLATRIVYQSKFVVHRWNQTFGEVDKPYDVIHNGVDLDEFSPQGYGAPPDDHMRIVMVEGTYLGGYDFSLKLGIDLANLLQEQYHLEVELVVAGLILPELQQKWQRYAQVPVTWLGVVDRSEIPQLHRSAHVFFSGELHPACPNAVIEALACGLPVATFDTGSLAEIVTGDAGRVVPYRADSWSLEEPDLAEMGEAVMEIYHNQPRFRDAARQRAEKSFNIVGVVDQYLEALRRA